MSAFPHDCRLMYNIPPFITRTWLNNIDASWLLQYFGGHADAFYKGLILSGEHSGLRNDYVFWVFHWGIDGFRTAYVDLFQNAYENYDPLE